MYKNVSENHASVNCFVKTNFCLDFMEICGKSGLGYEMCEHFKMVEKLIALFPETIILSDNVLESLSNGSDKMFEARNNGKMQRN